MIDGTMVYPNTEQGPQPLPFDEVQNQLGNIRKSLKRMNLDELATNVTAVEEGQAGQNLPSASPFDSFSPGNVDWNETFCKNRIGDDWREVANQLEELTVGETMPTISLTSVDSRAPKRKQISSNGVVEEIIGKRQKRIFKNRDQVIWSSARKQELLRIFYSDPDPRRQLQRTASAFF